MSEVRLIDANALKVKIQSKYDNDDAAEFDRGYNIGLGASVDLIDSAPTVEITERPTGKWVKVVTNTPMYDKEGIKTWGAIYQCPKCGFCHNVIEDRTLYKFCPDCGAKMVETNSQELVNDSQRLVNRLVKEGTDLSGGTLSVR